MTEDEQAVLRQQIAAIERATIARRQQRVADYRAAIAAHRAAPDTPEKEDACA